VRADEVFVWQLMRSAEDLLEIASVSDTRDESAAIVLDRSGAFRMLNAAGWSLPALKDEFGARAVFKVEKRGARVRVEGWDGADRCLLERAGGKGVPPGRRLTGPGVPAAGTLPQLFFPAP
jgi:hypothetical protein